jgi:fumarate reductase iron-sulfur subunit
MEAEPVGQHHRLGRDGQRRLALDPRDARTDEDFYELVGNDDGVFGCMTLLGCHDVCPKSLPLQTQIAFLRRRMARMALG